MTANSAPNSDPRRRFFDLFKRHWNASTGNATLQAAGKGWSHRHFADAAQKLGKAAPDPDTVAAWLKGTRWPKQSRRDAILAVFFPAGCDEAARQEMADAWEAGERAPRSPDEDIGSHTDDRSPPRWVRCEDYITEGLAELALAEPQAQSNDDGAFRIEGEPLVTVAEPEIDGRELRVGVSSVVVLFESESFAIRPDSRVSQRRDDPTLKTVPGGVQVSAAEATGCLDGPLWQGEYFAVVDSRNAGDGSMEITLRAARRSFRVAEVDARGKRKSVDVTEEKDAVLNILLGREQDKDTLGRIALARVKFRRTSE
jgi:hypothetical protein